MYRRRTSAEVVIPQNPTVRSDTFDTTRTLVPEVIGSHNRGNDVLLTRQSQDESDIGDGGDIGDATPYFADDGGGGKAIEPRGQS